jgi:hypothetical protein
MPRPVSGEAAFDSSSLWGIKYPQEKTITTRLVNQQAGETESGGLKPQEDKPNIEEVPNLPKNQGV